MRHTRTKPDTVQVKRGSGMGNTLFRGRPLAPRRVVCLEDGHL